MIQGQSLKKTDSPLRVWTHNLITLLGVLFILILKVAFY